MLCPWNIHALSAERPCSVCFCNVPSVSMTIWIACSKDITMQTQCISAASLFHIERFTLLLACLTITSCFTLPTISRIRSRLAQDSREFSHRLWFSGRTIDLNSARACNIPYLWCNNLYNCHPHARFDPMLWYTYSPKWPLFHDVHTYVYAMHVIE